MFPHSCTFYRKVNDRWERYPIQGVLWQDTEGINMTKSGLKDVNSLELIIPFSVGFQPCKKDYVLKGIVNYDVQTKPSELFLQGDVRTVITVDEFNFGRLKHYKVGGK